MFVAVTIVSVFYEASDNLGARLLVSSSRRVCFAPNGQSHQRFFGIFKSEYSFFFLRSRRTDPLNSQPSPRSSIFETSKLLTTIGKKYCSMAKSFDAEHSEQA